MSDCQNEQYGIRVVLASPGQVQLSEWAQRLVDAVGEDPTRQDILAMALEIGELLLVKNASYGDSALNPVRIFSKADPIEALKVRLDDKVARCQRVGPDQLGEETWKDICGYLILLMIGERRRRGK